MPEASIDALPPSVRPAVHSAGYRVSRWASARELLQRRFEKHRLPGALQEFLQRWLPVKPPHLSEPLALRFRLFDGRLLLCDESVPLAVPVERALLHLPGLRNFWQQELRRGHFMELLAMVPRAWLKDDELIPPGAVIHHLGVGSWEQLDRLSERTPPLEVQDGVVTESCGPQEDFNAIYHRDDKDRLVLRSLEGIS